MKKLFFTMLLTPIMIVNAQQNPYRSLKLENEQVVFQQVYDCKGMDANSVISMLATFVPTIKALRDYRKEESVITGIISGGMINFRKYGGKWGNTAIWVQYPYSANVSIVWKDLKYRVTLTNIVFHTAGFGDMNLTDLLTHRGRWETKSIILKAGEYIESDMTELFTAKMDNW